MKRILTISLGVFLAAGLVFFGFGSPTQGFAADPKQVIKITWAEQNNDVGYGPKYSEIPYLKRMEEATGNRIKFECHWGQTLVKGPDIWNAVKTGLVDAGWCFHNYWPGMTELANAISLPGLPFKDVEHASAVIYQIYQEFPSVQAEFKDVHVLTTWCDGHEIASHAEQAGQEPGRYERLKNKGYRDEPYQLDDSSGRYPGDVSHAGRLSVFGQRRHRRHDGPLGGRGFLQAR